jgi:nicotinamide mononucleotide transporter
MPLPHLLDINTVFFTFLNYPMSYLEFFGTVFNIWCVWLTAKGRISSWGVGIVGIVLYLFLFYQIQLYSDMVEQFYFLVMSFVGWWLWLHPRSDSERAPDKRLRIGNSGWRTSLAYAAVIVAGTLAMGALMSHIHLLLPRFFPEAASFPYLDAFTTVMSFAATVLMARKKVECWYLWILVDIIGIGLYYTKGVKFISLEYLVFLVLATKGLLEWQAQLRGYTAPQTRPAEAAA